MCRFFFFSLLLSVAFSICSQSRLDHWCIGDSIHLKWEDSNFVFQGFVPFSSHEGGASISDTSGAMLFYTDGVTMWGADHQVLDGACCLSDSTFYPYGSSVAQSAFILPGFDSLGLTYYVFTRGNSGGGSSAVFYSLVQLDLESGLGRIADADRRIQVFDSIRSEAMTAVRHGNGRDWWIIVSDDDMETGYQWVRTRLLSPEGMSDVSSIAIDSNDEHRVHVNLTANYTGDLIGFAALDYLYLLEFDRCDGAISVRKRVTSTGEGYAWYSLEFSSNSSYLYACDYGRTDVWQISTVTGDLVYKLPTISGPFPFIYGQIRRAPDKSIFIAYASAAVVPPEEPRSLYLGRIPYPDSPGSESGLDTFAVWLGGQSGTAALPHHPHYELGALEGSPCDTLSSQAVDTTSSLGGGPAGTVMPWLIYPNPVSTTLTVEHPAGARLVLHDLQGRSVRSFALNASPTAVSLDGIPDGLYVMVLRDRSGNPLRRSKVLVQR
jgi:hypothetical protein